MPDSRFFNRSGPFTLGEIASVSGAELYKGDSGRIIQDLAPLDQAGPESISFFDNIRYRESFMSSKAAACFVAARFTGEAPPGMTLLVTATPYKAYALAAQVFYPETWPEPSIASTAKIDPSAKIGIGVCIADGVVIGSGSEIGDGCWIDPNAVIGRNVILGKRSRIGACSSLSHCILGQNVRLYPGVRIGQDGFGFAIDPKGHIKVPQLGRVVIGDNVEIGANTTIDRGSGPDTVIGDGTWIDNLVQIGHNVKIGKGCIIVAQAGISGSTVIEDYAVLAGQAGIAGHLRVGKGARVGAQAGVMRDIPPGTEYMGSPALPLRQFMRQIATLNRLIKKEDPS